jgi:alpha-mannosidase
MDRMFHEKTPIGHFSKNPRDFDAEYNSEEEVEEPNDAQEWIEKAKDPKIQAIWGEEWIKATQNPDAWDENCGTAYFIGQSHIDVAWLWRYLQTVEKCRVTFSKAAFHIKNIPEFTFTGSQPILFDFVRRRYPELFSELQDAVKTGRFELAGGSWVEPDVHLISGESWARQRLYGQWFYQKYFNKMATIEWIPDSFGFTHCLPQILAKSNAKRFWTGKLDDNDTNPFPFITFWWESSDGSQVLTESLAGGIGTWKKKSYRRRLLKTNLNEKPKFNYEHEDFETHPDFSEELNHFAAFPYGKGDGGHGPTGKEVQHNLYLHKHGKIRLKTADQYFNLVESEIADRLPIWKDELYYEYHRGTLTSMAIVKHMNRYHENFLPALEALAVLAVLNQRNYPFPFEFFDEAWKMTMLNQFHDVLPGTCIPETYDDCWDIWNWQLDGYQKLMDEIQNQLQLLPMNIQGVQLEEERDNFALWLYNHTSFAGERWVYIPLEKFKGRNIDDYLFYDQKKRSLPFITLLRLESPDEPLYNLPDRMLLQVPMEPNCLQKISALRIKKNKKEPEEQDASEITIERGLDKISFGNRVLKAQIDLKSGALVSLKFQLDGAWMETIIAGDKKFSETAAKLEPGAKVHSFLELAKHFPAWNMWKESRQNPYQSVCKSVELLAYDRNHVIIRTSIEYPTKNQEGKAADDISFIDCDYMLLKGDPMLYLTYQLDFHGQKVLMKLDIPTTTKAERAECAVALGYESRSTCPKTARDKARWENYMHQWVNLPSADGKWGFAVLNHSKYGVDYHEGYLGVTLIHGQTFFPPKMIAWVFEERMQRLDMGKGQPTGWLDQGKHIFSLALYPHKGTVIDADVVGHAQIFNQPPLIMAGTSKDRDKLPELSHLPTVSRPLQIIALKFPHLDGVGGGWTVESQAEHERSNSLALVLRVLNPSLSEIAGKIIFHDLHVVGVKVADLIERPIESLELPLLEKDGRGFIRSLKDKWLPTEFKTFTLLIKK